MRDLSQMRPAPHGRMCVSTARPPDAGNVAELDSIRVEEGAVVANQRFCRSLDDPLALLRRGLARV